MHWIDLGHNGDGIVFESHQPTSSPRAPPSLASVAHIGT
jgi:hypothetical protein